MKPATSSEQAKRFLGNAAHQLKNPLSALLSQSELALHEKDPDALQQRLQKIHAAARHCTHLVQQILTLARSESEIEHLPFDLAKSVQEWAREWAPGAISCRIDLGYEGEDNLVISANQMLIREALGNLVDNAKRHAGAGSTPAVTMLTLRVLKNEGNCCIEVEDNGVGIDNEEIDRIFDRFWSTARQSGGTGLGLAIVKEVAQKHGGAVEATPVKPHGLLVRITLPLKMSGDH